MRRASWYCAPFQASVSEVSWMFPQRMSDQLPPHWWMFPRGSATSMVVQGSVQITGLPVRLRTMAGGTGRYRAVCSGAAWRMGSNAARASGARASTSVQWHWRFSAQVAHAGSASCADGPASSTARQAAGLSSKVRGSTHGGR